MTSGPATVGGALRYAVSLYRRAWRQVWAALALNALAAIVEAAGLFSWNHTIMNVGSLAQLFTGALMYASLYRLAFAQQHPGDDSFRLEHHGVQWGPMEWRLTGASVLVAVFTTFMLMLATLIFVAVLSGVLQSKGVPARDAMTVPQLQAALGTGGLAIVAATLAALALLVVYLIIRLSLAWPATADQSGVRVLQTWPMTRGRFWRLLISFTVMSVPLVAVTSAVAVAILTLGSPGHDASKVLDTLLSGTRVALSPNAVVAAAVVFGGVLGFVLSPLNAGIAAYFYLHRSPAAGAVTLTQPRGS